MTDLTLALKLRSSQLDFAIRSGRPKRVRPTYLISDNSLQAGITLLPIIGLRGPLTYERGDDGSVASFLYCSWCDDGDRRN